MLKYGKLFLTITFIANLMLGGVKAAASDISAEIPANTAQEAINYYSRKLQEEKKPTTPKYQTMATHAMSFLATGKIIGSSQKFDLPALNSSAIDMLIDFASRTSINFGPILAAAGPIGSPGRPRADEIQDRYIKKKATYAARTSY